VKTHPKQRSAGLEKVEKGAAAPVLGQLAFAARAVFEQFGLRLPGFPAPIKSASLINRVQGVNDDGGAGDRQPRSEREPAEAVKQLGFAWRAQLQLTTH
jgi:hypothetical protein